MHFFTKRPPLYGLFILFFETFLNSNYFVLFIQNILSVLNIIVLIKLLDYFNFSHDYKKTILLFLIFLPVQFIYNNMIMSEILLQTLLIWSFFSLFLFIQRGKTGYIIAFNIFLALAVLTKPVLLYFWIPNIIFLAYLFWARRRFSILISGLIMPLVIFLLSLYNYNVTGSFHYSSIRQMNLVGYNGTLLLVNVYGDETGQRKMAEIRDHLNKIENFSQLQKEEDSIGYVLIMNNKTEYAKYHIKGMINFFMDPGRFDLNNYLGIKEGNNTGLLYAFTKDGYSGIFRFIYHQPFYIIFYFVIVLTVNILFVLSLINFVFVREVKKEYKIFLFMIILYLCFFSGPLGTMRYKVHVIPFLLFTVPFLFEKIKNKIINRKTNPLKIKNSNI